MRDQRRAEDDEMHRRDRTPRLAMLEVFQSLMQGIYPNEARLEYLLDHIEGTA